MQSSEIIQPLAIGTAIANSGNKNIPPQTATGTDTSSISAGFLPVTSEPLDDGGIAPERIDFNGMFYLATDQRVFLQNGGVITYDDNVATAIGGYPQGAILGYITSTSYGFVKSLVDNNQYNFVTTPSYIDGVNWSYIPLTNTIETIKAIYPVGSIYIGMTSTCPLASLFGTWQLITGGLTLQQADSTHTVGTEIPAGLPNSTGYVTAAVNTTSGDNSPLYQSNKSGDLFDRSAGGGWGHAGRLNIDMSRSNSIYGNSTTVQPPALAVNIWQRTA